MRKIIYMLSIVLLLTGVSNAKTKIIIGTNATYPPLEFLDENSNPVGFDMELITTILTRLGYEYEFSDMIFDGLLPSLVSGKIDIIGSNFTVTKERGKKVDFSTPYLIGGVAIAYNKTKLNNVKTTKDLENKNLGCEMGTTGCLEINKIKGAKVTVYDDTTALYMALDNGKIDAIIADQIPNQYYIKTHKGTKMVAVQESIDIEEYAWAVKKGKHKKLLKDVDDELRKMKDNGEYNKLVEKWL